MKHIENVTLSTAPDGSRVWLFPNGRTLPVFAGGDDGEPAPGGADPGHGTPPAPDPAPTADTAPAADPTPSPSLEDLQKQLAAERKAREAAEAENDKHRKAQMSDLERAQDEARKKDEQLKAVLLTAEKARVEAAAARAGAKFPADAYNLLDQSAIERDGEGNISNAANLIAALIESGRLPKTESPAPGTGSGDPGNPGGGRSDTPYTDDALRKMTADQIARDFDKIIASRRGA